MPYGAYLRLPASVGDGLAATPGAAAAAARRPARDRDLPPAPVSARARADRPAPGRRALVLALGPLRGRLRRLAAPARAARGPAPGRDPARGGDDRRLRRAGRHRPRGGRRRRCSCPLAADSFPAPDRRARPSSRCRSGTSATAPTGRCCARSSERMPELVLLLIGEWHDGRVRRATRTTRRAARAPNLVWLGRRSDEEAARLILAAPTSGSCRSSAPSSTTPRCRTGSSSTRGSGGARSRRTSRACARGTAR